MVILEWYYCNITAERGINWVMRLINNNNVELEVAYINKVLKSKKRGFKRIAEEDYNIQDSELLELLKSLGYTKVKSIISRTLDITNSNVEVIEDVRQDIKPLEEVAEVKNESTALTNVDTNKLNLLLDNLDSILKLIPAKDNNTIYRSNDNRTISIRLDTGLYNEIKHRAERDNTTATELFNRAIEKYLNETL